MINKIIRIIKDRGLVGLIKAILLRMYIRRSRSYSMVKRIVSHGDGIEIGGPSPVFQKNKILPIYSHINSLDNCNFSNNTIWEGDITNGATYLYDKNKKKGQQFVLESTDMHKIKDESYDFLLSSHVIEHTANPIKALKEWMRVVKTGGHLILLIPHKDGTFDHNRPVTSLEHLIQDYQNDITEKDLTHLAEILKLHDLSLDLKAGTYTEFEKRAKDNYVNRGLHHHVFNSHLVVEVFDYLKLNIKAIEAFAPMHILIVAQKPQEGASPDNSALIDYVTSQKFKTPFMTDKHEI